MWAGAGDKRGGSLEREYGLYFTLAYVDIRCIFEALGKEGIKTIILS